MRARRKTVRRSKAHLRDAQKQVLVDAVLALVDNYGHAIRRVVALWQMTRAHQRRLAAHYVALGLPVPRELITAQAPPIDRLRTTNIAWHDLRAITLRLATMNRAERAEWTERYTEQLRRRIIA